MAGWQWFGRLHTATYRATRGRLGGNLAGLPMLLLTTTGRRTGEHRTSPLPYFTIEATGELVIVGSNNGAPRDPAWWLNLKANPEATIQVMGDRSVARARLAVGEERARLWPDLVAFNRPWEKYAERATRLIPVVILTKERRSGAQTDDQPGLC